MGTPFSNTRRVTSRSFSQFFPPFLQPVPLRPASPSLPPTSALLDSTTEPSQDHMEHMLPPTHHMLMLGLHTEHLSQLSMLDHSLLDQLLLLPQSPLPPMLLPTLLHLLPSLLLLPLPHMLLLQLLLLLLLLLLFLLDLFLPSSRLRMNLEMLLMDTRTSTVPSRNVVMPWVVSLDLTPMLMRLESTLSTILLMSLDSVWLVTTFQSPQSTPELLLFPYLTHLRLLLPRLASSRPSMLLLRLRDLLMPMLTTTHMLLLLMLLQHMLLPQPLLPMLLPPLLLPQLLLHMLLQHMLLPPMLLPQLGLLMLLPPMLLPQLLLTMLLPPMLLPQLLLPMLLPPMLLPQLLLPMLLPMLLPQLPMLLPQMPMLLPQLLLLLLHVRLSSPPSSS